MLIVDKNEEYPHVQEEYEEKRQILMSLYLKAQEEHEVMLL